MSSLSSAQAPTAAGPGRRSRLLRRIGAGSLALGTILGLGLVAGPVGVANAAPPDWTNVTTATELSSAFANPGMVDGGMVTLGGPITVEFPLEMPSNHFLRIDLNGKSLSISGMNGAQGVAGNGDDRVAPQNGQNGGTALTVSGELFITNGYLKLNGGNGGIGGLGSSTSNWEYVEVASNGGSAGDGGAGLEVASTGLFGYSGLSFGAGGGQGGRGGSGADVNAAPAGAAGNGGNGGVGIGIVNNGRLVLSEGASASPGQGGDAGEPGVIRGRSIMGEQGAAGSAGDALSGSNTSQITLNGNGSDRTPTLFDVYGVPVLSNAANILNSDPLRWPTKSESVLTGWSQDAEGGTLLNPSADVSGTTVYAQWGPVGGPDPNPNPVPDPNPATTPAVTSSSASTSTSSSAPSTPVSSPVRSSSRASTPASSSVSIPTNNVADPVTTSSVSPVAPPALPSVAAVNDSSASQFDVDTHTPAPGGSLVLTARGFLPGSVVDFWLHSTPKYLGSAIADVHGIAVLPVTLDAAVAGEHHVQSVGTGLLGEPRNLAQPITIAPPPAAAPEALAQTGDSSAALAFLAVLMLAGGAALMLADRRRASRMH